jgi:O-antigen/teichoic acid export membrane protein
VAYYSVPDQLVRRVSVLPMAFARSMFPRVAALDGAASRELSLRSARVLTGIVTPPIAVLTAVMHPFLSLWIDSAFAERASATGVVLAAGIWINSIAMVASAYLQGTGRPDVTARCHLIELLPHIALLWLCVRFFGAVGAAAAMLAISAIDAVLLMTFARMSLWRAPYFWQGAGWVALACIVGLNGYDAAPWRYVALLAILVGSVVWALRMSPELSGMAGQLLRRNAVVRDGD